MRLTPATEAVSEWEPLVLPIRGGDGVVRDYALPPLDGEQWLQLMASDRIARIVRDNELARVEHARAVAAGENPPPLALTAIPPGDVAELEGLSQREQLRTSLGDAADAMIRDRVSDAHLALAARVAFIFHRHGAEQAAARWEAGLGGTKAPAGNRADRRRASQTSTSTASGSATR